MALPKYMEAEIIRLILAYSSQGGSTPQTEFDYTDSNNFQHRFGINQFDVSALAGVPFTFDGTGSYIFEDINNYAFASLFNQGGIFSPIFQVSMKSTAYESVMEVEIDGFNATIEDVLNGTESQIDLNPSNFGMTFLNNNVGDIYQLYSSGTNIYLTGYNNANGLTSTILCDTDEINLTVVDILNSFSSTLTQDVLAGTPKYNIEVKETVTNTYTKLENYITGFDHYWRDDTSLYKNGVSGDVLGTTLYCTTGVLSTYIKTVPDLGDSLPGIVIDPVREFADNAAAVLAGLVTGAIYRTGDVLKIVH